MSSPRIAIIGCGAITHSVHLPGIIDAGWELATLCDLDAARLEETRATAAVSFPDVRVTTDYRELLADETITAVIIATPPKAHAPLSIEALAAGKHVLCEKPNVLSMAEARDVLAASERAPGTLQFFSSRFRDAGARRAREVLRSGAIGKPYHAEVQLFLPAARACDKPPGKAPLWFGRKEVAGGGPFMDMGQYFLDGLLWMLDWPELQRITASAWRGMPTGLPDENAWDVEDHMTLLAHFHGELAINLDITARVLQHWRWRTHILGTKGSLLLDRTREHKFICRRADLKQRTITEDALADPGPHHDLPQRLRDLTAILQGEDRPYGTTARETVALTRLCLLAYASSDARREYSAEESI